jgi:hypothetical protein
MRLGCFLETLEDFRKAPESAGVYQELERIMDAPGRSADAPRPGVVPGSWLCKREMGRAKLTSQRFADIYSSIWLAHLRSKFEPALMDQGLIQPGEKFDLPLLMSQRRTLTQQMARYIYDLKYDGIYYQSRHGHDLENWAVFEPFGLTDEQQSNLEADDRDFTEALTRLDLTLDPTR